MIFTRTWIFLVLFVMANMARSQMTIETFKYIQDMTAEVVKNSPSRLLTSSEDSRITNYARTQKIIFYVKLENQAGDIVIVNPMKESGFLWWKSLVRLQMGLERFMRIRNGQQELDDFEKKNLF